MAINNTLWKKYASSSIWRSIPNQLQALGEISDPEGNRLLSIAFCAKRDLITHIGYSPTSSSPEELCACAAVLCEAASDKPVMEAQLLGPSDIAKKLTESGELDDQFYYYALLATLALKNALSSYAAYRSSTQKDTDK